MKLKLFQKIQPSCSYCVCVKKLNKIFLCPHHGIVSQTHHCHKFKYDPLKRTPKEKQDTPKFQPEDFTLDA